MILTKDKLLDVLTCDLNTSRHIQPKDIKRERELSHSCWWDYRGLHPMNRTLEFAAAYVLNTQRFTSKFVSYKREGFVTGLTSDWSHLFPRVSDDEVKLRRKKTNLTGLWRARQAADELGISYVIYIWACFEKASLGGWERFPRPSHLYSDKMKIAALDEQVKEIERYIPDFGNPLLKVGSKAPFKRDFDKWLFELGSLRGPGRELTYKRMAQLGYINDAQVDSWVELAREA